MKKETIIKRLAKSGLWTKKGALNSRYNYVFARITRYHNGGDLKMHLKYWTKKSERLVDSDHHKMIELLNALQLKYNEGNDAPRGGVTGDFIYISASELRKLSGIVEL